jgi:lipid-binding SYLF domain-containing protein
MKKIMLGLMLSGLASAVMAIEPAELDNRIRTLTDKFEAFQHRPDNGISSETLRQAQGIILLDTIKGGLVFGYQGGHGVAMVKDAKLGQWSPAAFVKSGQASFGAQIGEEQNFYIILLMTTNATWRLIDPKIEFGAGAGGTANTNTGGVQTKTPSEQDVVVYNDRVGLYGGAVVKGGGISPDGEANRVYYGQNVSMRDILFDHKVQLSTTTSQLADKIDSYKHDLAGSKTVKN